MSFPPLTISPLPQMTSVAASFVLAGQSANGKVVSLLNDNPPQQQQHQHQHQHQRPDNHHLPPASSFPYTLSLPLHNYNIMPPVRTNSMPNLGGGQGDNEKPNIHGDQQSNPISAPSANSGGNSSGSNKKKHVCPTCARPFTTSGHLARHMRVHTGERNHKCPFPGCETRCSRQDNLQQQ
jgi:uncharacterized Zn-finger protein